MSKEIFISVDSYEKRVAVLANKRIEEFYIERLNTQNLVGSVYKGRVESVVPAINAAFVNLGLEKNGFIHVSDIVESDLSYDKVLMEEEDEEERPPKKKEKRFPSIHDVVKKGDELLVQVVKEPIRTKGARLTTHISMPGRFMVIMPFDPHIGVSKRISSRAERDRIRAMIAELNLPKDLGFIVRTAAEGVSKKDVAREVRNLIQLWNTIRNKAKRVHGAHLIHQEYDIILRVARDIFTSDVHRLEIDSRDEYKRVSRFLKAYAPHLKDRVKLYADRQLMFEKFDIQKQIDRIYERNVHLKSGGYLVFDETESLVAIDVNSGKSVGERNLEETAHKTNLEAAEEIPRQLKLRDIGGIIIIDFIDMEYGEHRKAVVRALERHIEGDKARTKILNISSIGLVEMTRQRMRQSIEGKSYQKCSYCDGRGIVKSVSTVAIELMRKITQFLAESKSRGVFVYLHPEVAAYLIAPERNMIKPLERFFKKVIRIIEDPNRHIEDIKIEHGSF